MLVSKLLRLENTLIQEVEDLAKKLSEKEYTSFSALSRKLIKIGLNNMTSQTPKIDTIPFALGSAAREETKLVREFLEKVGTAAFSYLPSYTPTSEENTLNGGFLMTLTNFRSLYKMDEPSDFQAVCGISRSLFERTVELVLITLSSKNFPITQLVSWEDSAKLKHCETMKSYYDANPAKKNDKNWKEYPKSSKESRDFITNKSVQIKGSRRLDGYHDNRWTGADLRQAAAAADKVYDFGLEQYYVLRHMPLCWNIHGSGLVGVRNISEENFPGISAFAFNDCAKFGMIIAELLMSKYHITSAFEKEFEKLKSDIINTKLLVISKYPDTFKKMITLY